MRSLFVLNLPMARDGRKYICPHIPLPFTGRDGVFRRIIRPAPGNSHLACRSHKKGANKGLPSFRKVGGEGKGGVVHTAEPCHVLLEKAGKETAPKIPGRGQAEGCRQTADKMTAYKDKTAHK